MEATLIEKTPSQWSLKVWNGGYDADILVEKDFTSEEEAHKYLDGLGLDTEREIFLITYYTPIEDEGRDCPICSKTMTCSDKNLHPTWSEEYACVACAHCALNVASR